MIQELYFAPTLFSTRPLRVPSSEFRVPELGFRVSGLAEHLGFGSEPPWRVSGFCFLFSGVGVALAGRSPVSGFGLHMPYGRVQGEGVSGHLAAKQSPVPGFDFQVPGSEFRFPDFQV